MLSLGTCRLCEAGPLGLRRCGVCRRVVVLCDECDAAWPTADTTGPATYATETDMPCPRCRGSLLTGGSHWATRADIVDVEWLPADAQFGEGAAPEPRCGNE